MSIDAMIEKVTINKGGDGHLDLIDRPGDRPGIRGQPALYFEGATPEVKKLSGKCIWGGSSTIMLGDVQIARREGYGRIIFDEDGLMKALKGAGDIHGELEIIDDEGCQ